MSKLEITVLSAEGLKMNTSPLFSQRLQPFIILTSTNPHTSHISINGDGPCHVYRTQIDHKGGSNPTWGDKFHLPIDTNFFSQKYSSIYLQIFSKRLVLGKAQLGWCQILSTDIIEGFRPVGSIHHLSYRVRARDGSRGHGVINVAVRLVGMMEFRSVQVCSDKPLLSPSPSPSPSDLRYIPASDVCQVAIGIPVTLSPALSEHSLKFDRENENQTTS